jgi:adenylate cyclase
MAYKQEIERKFLVHPERLPELKDGARLVQGYLCNDPTVRARTEETGSAQRGYLTIKGDGLVARDEFEYEIPFADAQGLLQLAHFSLVSKRRYLLPVTDQPDLHWEIDVFEGDNAGLTVAELEMPAEDHAFARPDWLGEDVTENPAYKNSALSRRPFSQWGS